MQSRTISRRTALKETALVLGAATFGPKTAIPAESAPAAGSRGDPFHFSLNMATLRGQKLGIVQQIGIAAKAGYQGVEPWVDSIQEYMTSGGTLKDLRQRLADSGLAVEGAIGFPEWLVEDESRRAKGLERARREMDMVAQIGGRRFAAPPAGATDLPKIEPAKAAERYRALLEFGDQLGIVPQFELWGFSRNFGRLSECVALAMETAHPKACVLADVFHLHKGGSDFRGMRLLGPTAIQVLHLNDYPADPPAEKINDSYRVFPGDGVAPLVEMIQLLHATGGAKVLSLELFNRKYWAEDPLEVARTGLSKMKAVVAKAQIPVR